MPSKEEPQEPQAGISLFRRHGRDIPGDRRTDALSRMVWLGLGGALLDVAHADVRLIVGNGEDCKRPSNDYVLSRLTATVREGREKGCPLVGLGIDRLADRAIRPALMHSLPFMTLADQRWPAKMVAAACTPKKAGLPGLWLSLSPHPLFGQWFGVGPREVMCAGVLIGTTAETPITHHSVGPRGRLPERTTLEYQVQGVQAHIRETAFTAWSVQNQLRPEDSSYIKVESLPAGGIVGRHPGVDQAEVFVINLN